MSEPTTEQIEIVRTNLYNLRRLLEVTYPRTQARIENAYKLLSEETSDPGLMVLLNIVEGAFWEFSALAAIKFNKAGPNFLASFLSGVVSYFGFKPPPSLNAEFSDIQTRYDKTYEEIKNHLDRIRKDLASNDPQVVQSAWNSKYTYNDQSAAVGDLATLTIPEYADPDFDDLEDAMVRCNDRAVWLKVIKEVYYFAWSSNVSTSKKAHGHEYPWPVMENFYNDYKSGYGIFFQEGGQWWIEKYYLCKHQTVSWIYPSDAACHYLFKDSVPGKSINDDGLFERTELAGFLGTVSHLPTRSGSKRGGPEAIKEGIIERAHQDAAFASKLAENPKLALDEDMGINVPAHISVNVVFEKDEDVTLVVPAKKSQAIGGK